MAYPENVNVIALLNEIERLKWECAGWKGRCEMAREERDFANKRIYQLEARLPPGPI